MNEHRISEIFIRIIDEYYEYFPCKNNEIKLIGCKDIKNIESFYLSYCTKSFINQIDIKELLNKLNENIVIISDSKIFIGCCNLIYTKNPRYIFAKAIKIFKENYNENIVEIGENLKIGKNCSLKNCTIGNNVTIGDNVVIGGPGFGYVKNTRETDTVNFEHYGRVIIKDNVSIHSLVAIDRGTLNDTIIEENCKIDNLCHIAHNVKIGKNTMISARSLVGGGTTIGENCWVGAGSTIIDRISICDNTFIGSGTNVTKSIYSFNGTWVGNPARRIK